MARAAMDRGNLYPYLHAVQAQSAFAPEAFTIGAQRFVSAAKNAANCSGVPPIGCALIVCSRPFISGDANPATISRLSWFTISFGIPAGPMTPHHTETLKSGNPDFKVSVWWGVMG